MSRRPTGKPQKNSRRGSDRKRPSKKRNNDGRSRRGQKREQAQRVTDQRASALVWGRRLARVVVTPGLEEILCAELDALGLDCEVDKGGAELEVTFEELERIHAHSRVASRVLIRLGEVSARSLDGLAQGIRTLPWTDFLGPNAAVNVRVTLHGARLRIKSAIEKKVAYTLGDLTRDNRAQKRSTQGQIQDVFVRVSGSRALISVDASGALLHRRGWRMDVARAPIRENLAAAVLGLVQWEPGEPLVDPMCGSGTFPIEAACIAEGQPARSRRDYAYLQWPVAQKPKGNGAPKPQYRTDGPDPTGQLILGADKEQGAIQASIANAKRAGMDQRVLFQHSELRHLQVPGVCGLVIMNPPYGQRLSNPRALNDLFHHIGAQLKRAFSGWRVGILIPDLRLVKALDLPLEDLGSFQNGGLRVWLMGGRIPAE